MTPSKTRNPGPASAEAGTFVGAGKRFEDNTTALHQQDFAALRISQRFGLPLIRARLLCDLASYRKAA